MKIDVSPHIVPKPYRDALYRIPSLRSLVEDWIDANPRLVNLDLRFRIMDQHEGLKHMLNLGAPLAENAVTPEQAAELCRIANDTLAELLGRYPDRFAGAIASLPLNDMDATLREIERTVGTMGFRGVQIFTDVNGKPLDSPEFLPLFEAMQRYDLPVLLHPRGNPLPEYPVEKASKYMVFVLFGWPYQTTVAMTRLAVGGVLEKYPGLKIVTHHCGGMVPFLANRIASVYTWRKQDIPREPLSYYRMFYADTVLAGNTSALMTGYDFFGPEHILFATDMSYGSLIGDGGTEKTIDSINRMSIPQAEKDKIFTGNALRIFRLD